MRLSEELIFEIVSRVIGDLSGPVSIDLESLILDTSKHGDDRLKTEKDVNEAIILDIVKRALPKIVQDYAN